MGFEKNHKEDLEKQQNLMDEIQKVQEQILKSNNSNLLEKVKTLKDKNEEECEYQRGVEKNISELKGLMDQSTPDDIVFEEKMRELHQDHNRNLQHQIEMMAQIDEMKKIYELEQVDEETIKSDEKAMRNLETIKRDHNKALLKQKQMQNDIVLIQMNLLSNQQEDDMAVKKLQKLRDDTRKQLEERKHHEEKLGELKEMLDTMTQDVDIDFEEKMRFTTQEHNRSLQHQLELMQQIDEMKLMYEVQETQKKNELDNKKFIEKVESFEKNHREDLEKQQNLMDEIQKV